MPIDSSSSDSLSRRSFLKRTGLLTVGFSLLPGCHLTDDERSARDASSGSSGSGGASGASDPSLPPSLARAPRIDAWLQVLEDGRIRVYTGKLELGQGIRVAIAQVAAEELRTSPDRVAVHLAETGVTPNERYTSASVSIEHSALSVRHAAATARALLQERAAARFGVDVADVRLADGAVEADGVRLSLYALLDGDPIDATVTEPAALIPTEDRRWIGTPVPRRDIRGMVRGDATYVQDLRFDGMLHARVLRPPGYDAVLESCDEAAVRGGVEGVRVVRNGSFVGVVAPTEFGAIQAQRRLERHTSWSESRSLPDTDDLPAHLRSLPTETESVVARGSRGSGERVSARYFRPYLMHGSIGPSCAVASFDGETLRVWTHSQGVYPLRDTLSNLLDLPVERIRVTGVPGSGCYGHNGADDVAADAALLAMAVPNRPVRLQWSRADEHGWEPYGSAMMMDASATLGGDGRIADWTFDVWTDTHSTRPGGSPGALLPARHTDDAHRLSSRGFLAGGYRNAVPAYDLPNVRVDAHFFEGPLRVSALRGLGAHANVFAIESFMEELADRAGADPVAFRRAHLSDDRATAVLDAVAKRAKRADAGASEGIGYGFARYKNQAAYCAVAAKVQADGDALRVTHLWGAIDAGEVINPDGLANQLEGGMLQSLSWMLHEAVRFDATRVTSREWSSYPILRFADVPAVDAVVLDRPDEPSLGAGEAAQGPATAAVANAISRATGRRVRTLPVRPTGDA